MRTLATIWLIFLAGLGQVDAGEDQDSIELQGMFSYAANAAHFRDCRTGKSFPVAMVGPYATLEQAYLDSGIEPGKELMVAIRGRYLERSTADGSATEDMLVVDVFEKVVDSGKCPGTAFADLRNTYWKLLEIDGRKITTPQGQQDAHLILAGDSSSVQGFAGCNSFFGQYLYDGETLVFSGLGSTMMACPEGLMDTETAFLQALGETNRAVIDGMYLCLYVGDRLLARLEADFQ